MANNPPANAGDVVLGREDPLEKDMATQCSTLAWGILWTEKPGGLPGGLPGHKMSERTEAPGHTHAPDRLRQSTFSLSGGGC